MRPVPAYSRESLGDWLKRHGQTQGAIERFWRLVIASALNADIDSIAMPYAAKVIRELFMNSAFAGSMGMSTVPLSELYAGVDFLRRAARRERSSEYDSLRGAGGMKTSAQWTAFGRGAGNWLPIFWWWRCRLRRRRSCCRSMPAAEGAEELAAQIEQHEHWPICSVHLWFDREITELDHAVLLDREIHWMYNQSRLQTGRGGHYIELVVSATRAFAALPRDEAIAQALSGAGGVFPAREGSEAGEGCAGEGGAGYVWRAAGD